ncbi:MAG: sugar ABC transporter substrate-binding protein, partial [Chloroflexi bacterium]|nr:sugar ABC transporter substrate-binding protein [Chloroflexota bacterium]
PAAEAVEPTEAAAEAETAEDSGKVLLGFANMVEGYEFATQTRQGIEDEAKKLGWEVLLLNNNFDADLALTNADSMVLKGVDIAVEFQLYEDVMPAMMAKFDEAKIPVITIDIPAPGATFVGVDNYQAGRLAGEWLGQYALDNWDGQADLVLLLDDPTVGELPKKRVDGIFDAIVEKLPDLDQSKIQRQPGGGMREKGLDITRAVLTANPDAHRILISGIDDISLLGGLAAVEELGREKDVVFFGQGGELEAIPEIRDSNSPYMGSVGYFFENYGKTIVATAEKLAAGEEVPEFVYVDIALITKDNVNEIYPEK